MLLLLLLLLRHATPRHRSLSTTRSTSHGAASNTLLVVILAVATTTTMSFATRRHALRALARDSLGSMGGGSVGLAVARDGRSAVLTVDNEPHRNALTGRMMVELDKAVETLEKNESLAVLEVRGKGEFFCSGADLTLAEGVGGAQMCALMQDVTQRISRLSAVSIAVIRGGAFGGGAELSTCCDLRVMASDAKMRWVHTRFAISPGWGGATRLTQIVGRSQALRILCTAPVLYAPDCKQLGLADVVADKADLDIAVAGLVAPMLEADPQSIRACKSSVAGAGLALDYAYDVEAEAFERVWGSPANLAAIKRGVHNHPPKPAAASPSSSPSPSSPASASGGHGGSSSPPSS